MLGVFVSFGILRYLGIFVFIDVFEWVFMVYICFGVVGFGAIFGRFGNLGLLLLGGNSTLCYYR